MEQFSLNYFWCYVQRLSTNKVQKFLEQHSEDINKLSLVDINQIFNFLDQKFGTISAWHNNNASIDVLTFKMIATKRPELSVYTFQELKNMNQLHPTIQVELAELLTEEEKLNLLKNFSSKLAPIVIQNFILALSSPNQKSMLFEYKDEIINSDFKLLLSFIGTLHSDNQILFLKMIKDDMKKLNVTDLVALILGVYEKNLEEFFKEYREIIENFDKDNFAQFLSLLSGSGILLCSKYLGDKIQTISADALMHKLEMSIGTPEQIYEVWKANPHKLGELSDTYFHLIISRLNGELRLRSLADFKERYEKMPVQELLDLFEFDSDEMKLQLFLDYPEKMEELNGIVFIDYVNNNIDKSTFKNKIFLLYKNKICSLSDEDFIYFIHQYSEHNFRYFYSATNQDDITKEELIDYILRNFKDRIQTIETKYIPQLFSDSGADLQEKYIEVLENSIKKLIQEKIYIGKLLISAWGNLDKKIIQTFKEQFQELSACDWYQLLGNLPLHILEASSPFLLECEVDNFDFIEPENILTSSHLKIIFYYLENNLKKKKLEYFSAQAQAGKIDELKSKYEALVTKIIGEEPAHILLDYNSITLLCLIRVLFQNHIIDDKDPYYQMFKEFYMSKLIDPLEKEYKGNVELIKDSIFYRLVKGNIHTISLTSIKTLKGLIFLNKNIVGIENRKNITEFTPAEIEPFVEELTEEQVILLNHRLFKQLCKKISENYKKEHPEKSSVRVLAIHLYLSLGYQNAMKLIDLHVPFTRYEYLFNGIDVKRIQLDEKGEPRVNKKLLDFLFGSNFNDKNNNINRVLQDKIPEFESHFSEVYNGWDIIYENLNGNVTVTRILKWFEENRILLNPDEYRLAPVLKEIGIDELILNKARALYADMKNRKFSTIPKVSGNYNNEYSYEMLDLDDPLGLAVGYITRCCFLINGMSWTSLFHSAQSKDGRIFIVRRNGELIAQSWVWRNGNLVCFDNVESRGNYDQEVLLEVYKQAAHNLLSISVKDEGYKEQIKLITFGGSYSKIAKPKKRVPEDKIRLPRVKDHIYTDASHTQFILASNGEQELYYGDVKAEYRDLRKNPEQYANLMFLDREQKSTLIKKIRAIEFVKTGNVRTLNFEEYCYATVADDWYLLLKQSGEVECLLLENDKRARAELYDAIDALDKTFNKFGIEADSKFVRNKVLSLVKGSEH